MRSMAKKYPYMKWVYYRRRVAAIAAFVLILVGLGRLADVNSQFNCKVDSIKAMSGDSLWSIAENHCTGNIQIVVEQMIYLNGGSEIRIGQIISLP